MNIYIEEIIRMLCSYGCGKEAIKQFKNGKWCCNENTNKCFIVIEKMKSGKGNKKRKKYSERTNPTELTDSGFLCDYGCGQKAKYHFKNGVCCCERYLVKCPIFRKKNSDGNRGNKNSMKNPEVAKRCANSRRRSGKGKGIYQSWETRRKRSQSLTGKKRGPQTKDHKRKLRKTMTGLWNDPNSVYHTEEYWEKVAKSLDLKPNKCEVKILNVLEKKYPNEWKFTGDKSFWIDRRNPDFTNINGRKKLIEHFGTYWHKDDNPQDLVDHYKKWGWETLVIWEDELKDINQVENKIKRFVEGEEWNK